MLWRLSWAAMTIATFASLLLPVEHTVLRLVATESIKDGHVEGGSQNISGRGPFLGAYLPTTNSL